MDAVEKFFTIASSIYTLCEKVKANKKECLDLAQRVKNWEPHIQKIKEKGAGRISKNVNIVLYDLTRILEKAEELVRSYSSNNFLKRLVKVNKHGDEFEDLKEQLDEVFQRLSTALHLETQDKIEELAKRDGEAKRPLKGPSKQDAVEGSTRNTDADKELAKRDVEAKGPLKGPSKQDAVDGSTGKTDADKAHFVMEKRAKVIQNAAHVMAIVESLQDKNMIHPEFYSAIEAERTDIVQMRKLYAKVIQPGGTDVRAAFYDAIKEHQPNLLTKLDE